MHKRLFVQMNKYKAHPAHFLGQAYSFKRSHQQMRKRLNEQIHKCTNVYLNFQTIV
jgi:hypothetical protein